MQDMDEQKAHAKLALLSKQNARYFPQTKCMHQTNPPNKMYAGHGRAREANVKLLLGTITFPTKCKIFPPNQMHAGHG
jgi:hypothetical protein